MSGETVSPWCIKLLRTAGEWSREDLAEATGAPADALVDYEEGRRPLTRETLETMVAELHLTEEDALALGSSIPRARPWMVAGPGLSDQERSIIGLLTAQVGREVQSELFGQSASGHPGSDVFQAGAIQRVSGIVRSVWGRYFLEMLIREGSEWDEVWHPCPEDRLEGEELWSRLERFPVRDRNFLVDTSQEFAHWALCERICIQSSDLADEDPRQAMGLAELAVRIAQRVPGEDGWRSRLKGFALAHLAFARSALGDAESSVEMFREAQDLWDAGASGDPGLLDGSCLLIFEACLRDDHEEALVE